jgi:gliding motility-associated-like protein
MKTIMRKALFLIFFFLSAYTSFAEHLKGGFLIYKYLGMNADGTSVRYRVTLSLYMDCNAREGGNNSQVDASLQLTVFDAATFAQSNYEVALSTKENLQKLEDEECITGDQRGCYYKVINYEREIELPANQAGYIISYQRCCRISGVDNVSQSSSVGNTYSITIPGGSQRTNSSADFERNDTPVLCTGSFFSIPFVAKDFDGDDLNYEFCGAWEGGTTSNPAPNPASKPPYKVVNYPGGFSATSPLGSGVSIDNRTGIISGIAPSEGEYVITVCVYEVRGGVVIASNRKELHVKVGNCTPVKPTLDPEYITCDGFTMTFLNKTPSPEIKTYYWEFGVENSTTDFSTAATPTFTYTDTGVYTIKAVVNRGLQCPDSTTARVKIFPGFFPDFTYSACSNNPTRFLDRTTTTYGQVNSWSWNLGDDASEADTSHSRNANYTYKTGGKKNIELIVSNSKGCIDTLNREVTVMEEAYAGRDTTIVVGQQLQLEATGGTGFTWTPPIGLSNANIANPVGDYDGSVDSVRYKVLVSTLDGSSGETCVDSAFVTVKIFNTRPQVFVPTAFTPNNDGKNDLAIPIAAGIKNMEYFRVFNRWGELVFSTSESGKGWDGRVKGQIQHTGTFVWLVKATDYLDRPFFAKGTITLIQ